MAKYYVGFDIGGTTIKMGIFDENKKLIIKNSYKTAIEKKNPEKKLIDHLINLIIDYCKYNTHNIKKSDIKGIGFDVPGPVVNNKVLRAVNINWHKPYDIVKVVKSKFGKNVSVSIMNDANAAALGEYDKVLKSKYDNICLITLGTALGTGVIVNGELIEGHTGIAGELGHIKIDYSNDAIKCNCGNKGCAETVVSGRGIVNIYKRIGGKKYTEAKDIIDAAKKGDKLSYKALDRSFNYLSSMIVMLMHVYEPEVILIGGGVSYGGTIITKLIKKHVKEKVFITKTMPKIMFAKFKNDAGIYGVVSRL